MLRILFKSQRCFLIGTALLFSGVAMAACAYASPHIGDCPIFPPDSAWNRDISRARINPDSKNIISRLQPTWKLRVFTIKPYNIVDSSQKKVPVHYIAWGRTSDPGPMPIPAAAVFMHRRSGTSPFANQKNLTDNHLIVVDKSACKLYELWSVTGANPDGSWNAGSGAIYDLRVDKPRPPRAASATASGLPVFVGMVRPDEMRAGLIEHALSMTTTYTRPGYVAPATSYQRQFGTGPDWDHPHNPVMGMRLRLKAAYDLSRLGPQARIIAAALKKYGGIITDGSPGAGTLAAPPDPIWDQTDLVTLWNIPAEAFEIIDAGEIKTR